MTDKNQTSENRELPAHIKDLASKIKAGISVDSKTGIGKEIDEPGKLFKQNLPDGVTQEMVKKVNNYTSDFVTATTVAAGELSIQALKENDDLDTVTTKVATMNRNVVMTSVKRGRVYNDYGNPKEVIKNDKGEIVETIPSEGVKIGFVKTGYRSSFDRNSGNLKLARNLISQLAEEEGLKYDPKK